LTRTSKVALDSFDECGLGVLVCDLDVLEVVQQATVFDAQLSLTGFAAFGDLVKQLMTDSLPSQVV